MSSRIVPVGDDLGAFSHAESRLNGFADNPSAIRDVDWAVARAAMGLSSERRLVGRLERLLTALVELIGVPDAEAALLDQPGETFEIVAGRGRGWARRGKRAAAADSLIGNVAHCGRPVQIDDLLSDPRVGRNDTSVAEDARSWLGAPLVGPDGVFGVVIAFSPTPARFGPEEERRLQKLVQLSSGALHDARVLEEHRQERERLAETAQRLRDSIDAAADWLWEQDAELRFTWVFPTRRGPADWSPLGPIGVSWLDSKPLGVGQDAWVQHEETLRARFPFRDFLVGRLGKDGNARMLSVSGAPIFDSAGVFHGYRGTAVDVTARRLGDLDTAALDGALADRARMDAALQEWARRQTALADLGELARSNRELPSVLAAATVVVAGGMDAEFSHVLRLLPDGESLVLEAGVGWRDGLVGSAVMQASACTQARAALTADQPAVLDERSTDNGLATIDLLREHGVASGALVTIRATDRPYGLLGVYASRPRGFADGDLQFLRAVSNILAAAIDLERSARTIEALVENVSDLVSRYDADLRCLYGNTAFSLVAGRPIEHLRGGNIRELGILALPEIDAWELIARSVFRGGRERESELTFSGVPGAPYYHTRFVPEVGVDGSVESILVIARDVSEQKWVSDENAAIRHELLERDKRQQVLFERLLSEQRGREQEQRQGDAALIEAQLTPREVQILRLLTAGMTNQQIAARLHLSAGTVRNHLGRLFPKLDATDRTRAAVRAVELGLVDQQAV